MDKNRIKQNMLKQESGYSKYAVKDQDAIRLYRQDCDIRGQFFRDIDRIIHSLSYTRFADKTQVFSMGHNDHVSKRFIHVQLVSKIARTIGRALNLNEDLIEAIALGHDIGHVPFGHAGEKILNELSKAYLNEPFYHNVQSVRTFLAIENNGDGNNLTIQVLDGILCHNGEELKRIYKPKPKTKQDFLEEYEYCYTTSKTISQLRAMSLEGCVVRISDVVAYIGRDIEDAILLDIIKREDIPSSVSEMLGNDNRSIINHITLDIINESLDKPYIAMSKPIFQALQELLAFNYQAIYGKSNSKEQLDHYSVMFKCLFEIYLSHIDKHTHTSEIYTSFLNEMTKDYQDNTSKERQVIDFIAGMTDQYFLNQYKKYNH